MQSRLKKIELEDSILNSYLILPICYSFNIDKLNFSTEEKNHLLQNLYPYELDFFFDWQGFKKINLEFCCGVGDFLVQCAENSKDQLFIGIDVIYPCIQRGIKKAHQKKLSNILFYCGDGNDFLWDFQKFSFDVSMINFPDPWPKKKHIKRRIINKKFIQKLLKVIKKKGLIISCTDVKNLYEYHLEFFLENKELKKLEKDVDQYIDFYSSNYSVYQKKNLAESENFFYTVFQKIKAS